MNRTTARLIAFYARIFMACGVVCVRTVASEGTFRIETNDVIVFCGGEDVVASQRNGCLETLLTLAAANQTVRFRNMGWEGDTAYEQRRDLNFGSWLDQLRRVQATVVVAQFGQSESFQGKDALPQFVRAYEKLLDEFAKQTSRIVLLSPTPFEKNSPPLPDLSSRNDDLQAYVAAIHGMAQRRGHRFVDLFKPLQKSAGGDPRLTRDGLHLGDHGHWLAAREVLQQLSLRGSGGTVSLDLIGGARFPASCEPLRATIIEKNQFWFDYWRPMNWAFLNGDRTEQPSSRDHRDPKIRWFPQELEKFWPLIQSKEAAIAAQVQKPL